jgi:tRNA nucleotidyltransferase (CCA-adding enzyme)
MMREDWYFLMNEWEPAWGCVDYMKEHGLLLPELQALVGVQQDPHWHPEGDVYEHTRLVVTAMSSILSRGNIVGDRRIVLMLAALCHDMGKAVTTVWNEVKQRWSAKGHDVVGVPIAAAFLKRIGVDDGTVRFILPLVRRHMAHTRDGFTEKAVRKLARKLQPACLHDLLLLMEADYLGRGPASSRLPEPVNQLIALADLRGWMFSCHPADRRG